MLNGSIPFTYSSGSGLCWFIQTKEGVAQGFAMEVGEGIISGLTSMVAGCHAVPRMFLLLLIMSGLDIPSECKCKHARRPLPLANV